jgi:hypothetical protein
MPGTRTAPKRTGLRAWKPIQGGTEPSTFLNRAWHRDTAESAGYTRSGSNSAG